MLKWKCFPKKVIQKFVRPPKLGAKSPPMDTASLKKKLNIEKRAAIGGLNLPEGRELKEEETE